MRYLRSIGSKRNSKGKRVSIEPEREGLINAIITGNKKRVKKELNDELDQYGYTALMYAARYGHTGIAELLLEKDANVNAQTQDRSTTALMLASYHGYIDIAELLLKKGANVNTQTQDRNTALMLAVKWGKTNEVKKTVKLLLENGADVNAQNKYGDTALIRATGNGHLEVVKILLKNGADVNKENGCKNTAIVLACKLSFFNRNYNTIKLLLENEKTDLHTANLVKYVNSHQDENSGIKQLIKKAQEKDKEVVKHLENGNDEEKKETILKIALNYEKYKTILNVEKLCEEHPEMVKFAIGYYKEDAFGESYKEVLNELFGNPNGRLFIYLKEKPEILRHISEKSTINDDEGNGELVALYPHILEAAKDGKRFPYILMEFSNDAEKGAELRTEHEEPAVKIQEAFRGWKTRKNEETAKGVSLIDRLSRLWPAK